MMTNRPATPIPIPITTAPREFSSLRSMRDKGSPSTQWKEQIDYAKQINSLTQFVKVLWDQVQKIRQPSVYIDQHPFKIYSIPPMLYPSDTEKSGSWRTFKVRGGCVLTDIVSPSSIVFGTDNEDYPDHQSYNIPVEQNAIVVPLASPQYWFWIEKLIPPQTNTGSYILRHGENPASVSTFNPNPWINFPSSSNNHIPIGFVDTNTSGSAGIAYVRQYLRNDVLSTGTSSGSYIEMNVCENERVVTYYVNAFRSGSA
jgi:hypothetical protein